MTLEEARGVLRREVRHDDHPRDADFYCPRSNDDLVWDDPDTPCTCGASERADEFTRLLALLDAQAAEVERLRVLGEDLAGVVRRYLRETEHEVMPSGNRYQANAALSRWEEVSGG